MVVTSDGDLQNDPADIPRLLARLDEGLRHGVRLAARRGRIRSRSKVPSWFANRLISWATGVHLHDYGCSLKAMRAEVVRDLRLYGEMHRFIPAVASWMGVSVAEMRGEPSAAHARARASTASAALVRVLLDLFTVKFLLAYGTRPAHLFGDVGHRQRRGRGSRSSPTSPT